ncbi:ABC transporter permease [Actinocorallia longicatena]|uniref:ABC transporter permease n=1 Tax=Actinocorallia longicatena TaxID=111803 RepID=A0ABP6Q407_9ACTN
MTTAIHDIGYRHYDGPRHGRAFIVRSLYLYNLRAVFGLGRGAKAKIIPVFLFVCLLLPAAVDVAILAFIKEPKLLMNYSMYPLWVQPLIAIFLATQAPVIASREIRFKTVPLYFSRPVRTLDFVLAKFLAFVTALFALIAIPLTLLHLGFLLTRSGMVKNVREAGPLAELGKVPSVVHQSGLYLAALAGCLLFALVLASFALVIAAYTPRRGFGVAAVIAVYLISNVVVAIIQGVAISSGNWDLAKWMNLFTPFPLVDGVQTGLLHADVGSRGETVGPRTAGGGLLFLAANVAVVAGSLSVLLARFRKAGQ